jgi:hypothetical protein
LSWSDSICLAGGNVRSSFRQPLPAGIVVLLNPSCGQDLRGEIGARKPALTSGGNVRSDGGALPTGGTGVGATPPLVYASGGAFHFRGLVTRARRSLPCLKTTERVFDTLAHGGGMNRGGERVSLHERIHGAARPNRRRPGLHHREIRTRPQSVIAGSPTSTAGSPRFCSNGAERPPDGRAVSCGPYSRATCGSWWRSGWAQLSSNALTCAELDP